MNAPRLETRWNTKDTVDTKEQKMGLTFVSLGPIVLIQPRYSGF
jgi:hypothetical protein